MEDVFKNAELQIARATSIAEIKRATARLLIELFKTRPATRAHMAVVMARMLDMHEDLEKKRQSAAVFVTSIRDQVNILHKAS